MRGRAPPGNANLLAYISKYIYMLTRLPPILCGVDIPKSNKSKYIHGYLVAYYAYFSPPLFCSSEYILEITMLW